MNTKEEILAKISQMDNIWIFPHIDPDGDSLGSAYGLKCYLESKGKRVQVMTEYDFQTRFGLQEGYDIAEETPENIMSIIHKGKNINIEKPDFIIALDSSNIGRLGFRDIMYTEYTEKGNTINIDHHGDNNGYGSLNYVDSRTSSCGEVLCDILLNLNEPVMTNVAHNLYVAIMSDSQSLRTENSSHKTTEWYSNLEGHIHYPDKFKIIDNIFQRSEQSRRLESYAIQNWKTISPGIKFACINRDIFEKYNAKSNDAKGIVGEMLNTAGVNVSILAKEKLPLYGINGVQRSYKISMRSKMALGGLNVREVCKHFPDGGGHEPAAGCNIIGNNIDENYVYEVLKKAIKEELYNQRGAMVL